MFLEACLGIEKWRVVVSPGLSHDVSRTLHYVIAACSWHHAADVVVSVIVLCCSCYSFSLCCCCSCCHRFVTHISIYTCISTYEYIVSTKTGIYIIYTTSNDSNSMNISIYFYLYIHLWISLSAKAINIIQDTPVDSVYFAFLTCLTGNGPVTTRAHDGISFGDATKPLTSAAAQCPATGIFFQKFLDSTSINQSLEHKHYQALSQAFMRIIINLLICERQQTHWLLYWLIVINDGNSPLFAAINNQHTPLYPLPDPRWVGDTVRQLHLSTHFLTIKQVQLSFHWLLMSTCYQKSIIYIIQVQYSIIQYSIM